MCQCVVEPIHICAAKPVLGWPVQHRHSVPVFERQHISELAGAIRRVIVDDQHVERT
jgi:hypothetical protein